LKGSHSGERNGPTARRPSASRPLRLRALAAGSGAWIVLSLGCDGPTLWIGDALHDAGSPIGSAGDTPPPPIKPTDASLPDAYVPRDPVKDAATPPTTTVTTGSQRPQKPPPSVPDAAIDDDDAGKPPVGPRQSDRPVTPAVLRPTDLPRALTPCPLLKGHGTYRFGDPSGRNLFVEIYIAPDAKTKPGPGGPLILYWHAVGDDSTEVVRGFGQPAIDEVLSQGGVVASFNTKLCASCGIADDAVWYDQDDPVTDHVVACALDQAAIDIRRIHSIGFSAGALRSLHLALARSNYIASVVSYSGGMLDDTVAVDPNNKVPAILSYGRQGLDTIVLNFTDLSLTWYETNRARGYYSMLCAHNGTHDIPEELVPHVLQFFRDHPYRVQPEPYVTAIPAGYPKYCSNEP
jgi:predicted esterase